MTTLVALIAWLAITAYVVLGGADYGAGFWELTAGGARRGARPRALIDHAMAPVWEANNVWLIFALVVLWTGFPAAFASIMSTLVLPMSLAAAGIVLRGSGFVFHKATHALTGRRVFGAVFALSSLMTPFFLGASFGTIASGRVPGGSWLGPTSVLVGVLAVACAAFLSAVFLVVDARRTLDDGLERYFQRRAIGSGAATGVIAVVGLFVLRADAPVVFHGLVREGLPFVIISALCGLATMGLLLRRAVRGTRVLAAGAVVALLAGWGVAQYPFILPGTLTIADAAGAPRTMGWLFVVFLIAGVTAVPALVLLFVLDQRNRLQEGAQEGVPGGAVVAGERRPPRHRVVVVGGGFGGLFATRALGWSPVDVTLIDRQPHHLFQPMLYQLATGIVSEGEIAPSLRHILRFQGNAAVLLAEVTGFDLQARIVRAQGPDGAPLDVPYDSLIVAAGAGLSYFGHDELADHAPGMKTLADALRLRGQLLQALEMAELSQDPRQQAGWLTVAIVGAGPTGVEIAGQIRELAQRALGTSFRRIDPSKVRVLLLDAGHEPLSHFGDRLAEIATRELTAMGVELRMGVRVTSADDESVTVQSPAGSERIDARTVIWAAGVQASPLAGMLATASGAPVDRAGRIEVAPDCTVPHYPDVFAIGDMASLDHLPGVAEVAMQQGLHAARAIRRFVAGKRGTPAFKYRDLGSMATVGRFSAIVSLKGLRLSGLLGWLTWLVVHITFLTGFANRFSAMLHWARSFFGRSRGQLAYSARFKRT